MAFKFVVFAALVAVARAGNLAPYAYAAAPTIIKAAEPEPFDPNPQYSFAYDVQDNLSGDYKSQSESRNGDVVQGQYALNDADGTRRIVDYTADPINGFNAVVRKEPLAVAAPAVVHKTIAAPAPIAYSAPVVTKTFAAAPAPIAYSAPVVTKTFAAAPATYAYSAPVVTKTFAAPAPAYAYSAPIAKFAAPVASLGYAAASPAVFHSSFSTPYASYTF